MPTRTRTSQEEEEESRMNSLSFLLQKDGKDIHISLRTLHDVQLRTLGAGAFFVVMVS